MTEDELKHVGVLYHYWPSAAAVTANLPMPMICQRAEIDGGTITLHGTAMNTANGHIQVGDPTDIGMDDFPPAELVGSPAAGDCTERPVGSLHSADFAALQASVVSAAYGSIVRTDGGFTIPLSINTWETMDGGSATLAQGVTYDDETGEITVSAAGVYLVSLVVAAQRGGILTTQTDAAIFVDNVMSSVFATTPLAVAGAPGNLSASGILDLDSGAVLTARVRSDIALTLTVPRFSVSIDRVA